MAAAKRTELFLIGLALVGSAAAGLALSMTSPTHSKGDAGDKSYAIAISGRSSLRLIELGAQQRAAPTNASGDDRHLYCRKVARAAGLELGVACASEVTTFADASQ